MLIYHPSVTLIKQFLLFSSGTAIHKEPVEILKIDQPSFLGMSGS